MNLNVARTQDYLKQFDFKRLFTQELGWDLYRDKRSITIDGQTYNLSAIAQKSGMAVYHAAPSQGQIPPYNVRRKIEQRVAKLVREHIIIYTDAAQTTQVWQWVKREPGKPLASREHTFSRNQSGELLIQKLDALVFTLAEEAQGIGIFDVVTRVRTGFDLERITRRFYDRFKAEHDHFLKMLAGIPDEELERWYVSVMLNRLMFIYFVQKKGFLDGDTNYLRNRLSESKTRGKDRFYREVLLPLFFKGFALKQGQRDQATEKLLGDVPYLNGGLFTEHYIERQYGTAISIPDSAFVKLFAFFDEYQWHLDDRPLRNDNEINPDVLGYIFEKYINQKQMGAYYTKEDITEYISKSTIIPFLFDAARQEVRIAFDGDNSLWRAVQTDPDRYIYDAVKMGLDRPLPAEIEVGIEDVAERTEWNKPAPAEYALPTEIWREVVARRQRYEEVRAKLANGEIREIDDFITYNLNLRQLAQDVIENAEGPELVRAFWRAIQGVSILDPTCGSGAFLFAALNILEPLYEACLDRMQAFVQEYDEGTGSKRVSSPQKYRDFREILAQVEKRPNRAYFILKSIIVNNLYGVDIMAEAIEICKLRLFLKLVAQIERDESKENFGIQPLPDIDFNIRAGNTLVGFATREQVKQAIKFSGGQHRLMFDEDKEALKKIDERAEIVDRAFQQFRLQQTKLGGEVTAADKEELRNRLKDLENELNQYLAKQYGINPKNRADYTKWLESYKPFHWFVEFYGILKHGGFDVIIGNPPYVEYTKVLKEYTIRDYVTESCGNLYAFVVERNETLGSRDGRSGMIIPHSAFCTDRMEPLARLFLVECSSWISTYGIRPAKLFVGVDQRLGIYVRRKTAKTVMFCTRYNHWNEEFRSQLFAILQYSRIDPAAYKNSFLKAGSETALQIWEKICTFKPIGGILAGRSTIYFHNAPRYWIRAMTFLPYFWNERDGEQMSGHLKPLHLHSGSDSAVIAAALRAYP